MLRQQSVASLSKDIRDNQESNQPSSLSSLRGHLQNEQDQFQTGTQKNLLKYFKEKLLQSSKSIINQEKRKSAQYYDSVLISKLACLKILQHSIKGKNIEVMGMLVGSTMENRFVVFDCYELPVEGTETRVNAQSESYEYMVQYMSEMIPETHHIVGWYHSHPGYDCWLSSIDMHTQDLNQNYQDPYLAIVVDPFKSQEQRKLSIGAFRTYHTFSDIKEGSSEKTLQFYDLNISIFDSNLNNPLKSTKLSLPFPDFDLDADASLIQSLVEIFKEWNTLGEITKKSLAKVNSSKDFFIDEEDELLTDNTEESTRQAHQIGMFQGPTRSSSFVSVNTSTNDDSDVDMDVQQLGDLESVSSSVHTVTEPASPCRRTTQINSSASKRSGSHAMSLIFQARKDGAPTIGNEMEGIRDKSVRAHFNAHKKALMDLKLEEYKRLRFLKDTFTLRNSAR